MNKLYKVVLGLGWMGCSILLQDKEPRRNSVSYYQYTYVYFIVLVDSQ